MIHNYVIISDFKNIKLMAIIINITTVIKEIKLSVKAIVEEMSF